MKVLVLYRPNSEHRRAVEEFISNFKSDTTVSLETIDIDSREGSTIATTYDIVQYPAILVMQSDGSLQKMWQGTELPPADEVKAYAIA